MRIRSSLGFYCVMSKVGVRLILAERLFDIWFGGVLRHWIRVYEADSGVASGFSLKVGQNVCSAVGRGRQKRLHGCLCQAFRGFEGRPGCL